MENFITNSDLSSQVHLTHFQLLQEIVVELRASLSIAISWGILYLKQDFEDREETQLS